MGSSLDIGFELDRRWHLLRGEMERTKEPTLVELARVLATASTPYAIIGGVAMQVRQTDPRTTIDVDVAVLDRGSIPAAALEAAGFHRTGSFPHSENWSGPGSVPVQFTDDPLLHEAVRRAEPVTLGPVALRVARAEDLLHAKLRAAGDPARRRSKRVQDLADAISLVEAEPALAAGLTDEERRLLDGVPR